MKSRKSLTEDGCMSLDQECPKCSSAMREGGLFIQITNSVGGQNFPSPMGFPTSSMSGMPSMVTGEGPFWREKTGEKKGWILKREETQTLSISGRRCLNCGYIELYAHQ